MLFCAVSCRIGLTIRAREEVKSKRRATSMYCTKCGAKLPRDARFCMNCGKPVAVVAPVSATTPSKGVASAVAPAKVTAPVVEPVAASAASSAKAAESAASSGEAAAPAAAPAKAVVAAGAAEAAGADRHGASPVGHSSDGSSLESAAFADEPEKSCEAGACGASSVSQEDVSPKRPETLRGAVNATKHRSRRRVPMVVLVALAMALAAGTAYAAYRVYTDVWLPAQQNQNEQVVEAPEETVEAPEEITYSVETRSMDVSVPVDPYDAPGKREAQKWYYPHIEASTQSDAVDKINAALEESMRSDVEKTNAAPDTAKDMGGAIVFICQYRSITLTYIDNDIVCVRDQRYDTGWGPHGSTTVTGCAYSLETGDPIDPVSAFGLTPEQAKSAVADAVTAYLATDPSDTLSTNAVVRDITNMCLMSPALGSGVDVENPLDGCSHFYIASEGLVFATEDYQMGSYAYGRREILVAPSDGSLAKVGDTVAIEAPMGFSGSGQASSQ